MQCNVVSAEVTIIVALRNLLLKIDHYSGSFEQHITPEKLLQWNLGLQSRTRYPSKVTKEAKPVDPYLNKILDTLRTKKKSLGDAWKGSLPLFPPDLMITNFNSSGTDDGKVPVS